MGIYLFVFLTSTGTVLANEPVGTVKAVEELPVGSILYDAQSLWEHKSGNNYSGAGETSPVAWVVVAKNHPGYPANSVTLLARGTVASHAFDDSYGVINGRLQGTNYWVNSKIRAWLNNDFYNHLSQYFKDVILTTNLPSHESLGRAYTTDDKIFLPSITELGYIKDKASEDAYAASYIHESGSNWGFFTSDESRKIWTAENRYGVIPYYWTRSPYGGPYMFTISGNGYFSNKSYPVSSLMGVRPALNIKADTVVKAAEDGKWEFVSGTAEGTVVSARPQFGDTAGGTGEIKSLRELSTGSLVYDAASLWQHKEGPGYTGSGEEKPVLWLVVAKNHPGYPANSVTLLTRETIAGYAFDNSTDRGQTYVDSMNNWGSSGTGSATVGIRSWLNTTFFNHLSRPFQNAVLTTTVPNKTGAPTPVSYTTEDKVFLPSVTELNGGGNDVVSSVKGFTAIGENWSYFTGENSKKVTGVTDTYWTRTPQNNDTVELFIVTADGMLHNNSARHAGYGVRPALNVSAGTRVKHVGNNTWQIVWTEQVITPQPSASAASRPSAWAEKEIEAAKGYGLITEKVSSNYQTPLTRGEFCKLAVKLYETLIGEEARSAPANTFTDTNNPEILKAYNLGIVNGIGGGRFAPDNQVTREQIAVMFYHTIKAVNPDISSPAAPAPTFTDAGQIASWAKEAVNDMSARGIIAGLEEGRFDPQGSATREQGIVLVIRVYEQMALR